MLKLTEEELDQMVKLGYPETNIGFEGYYLGGDKIVEWQLGSKQFLPFSIQEIIHAGIQSLSADKIKLHEGYEVGSLIIDALENKNGLSVIRLGDGELLAMAHDIFVTTEEINTNPRLNFLTYAGINIPDHKSRDKLAANVLEANVVGIPIHRLPTYQNMFIKLAKHHQWPLKTMYLTNSLINYQLYAFKIIEKILKKYKVLLIGNRMGEIKEQLRHQGYKNIVGTIPVHGLGDVDHVIEKARDLDFDCALVAAGIPANFICVQLAKEKKVVAIDSGHLIDRILENSFSEIEQFVKEL